MKQRYFGILIFSLTVLAVGLFFVYSVEAGTLNTGLNYAAQTGLSGQDIRITIAKIIRIILGFLGIMAVGIVLYAGFLWMSSGGNEEKIAQAKLILRNGVIGLVIVLSSFAIATFILNKLISATGGGGGETGGSEPGGGIGALGNGIVKSVYPEPYQKNVPRNTSIIVTFREPILASSICSSVVSNLCASGTKIKPDSVKLFKTETPTIFVTDVYVSSKDNKTFIFKPAEPIGSPNSDVNYTVKLTRDIKKANGSNAFTLSDFYWSFTTNNLLDLISPKIKSVTEGGIFPLTDNEADTISGVQPATKAKGNIRVNGAPNAYRAASAKFTRTQPLPPPSEPDVSIRGTNTCEDGVINVSISVLGANPKALVGYSQPGGASTENPNIINNEIKISRCNIWLVLKPGFAVGYSWKIDVVKERASDTLTVGSRTYSFVSSNASQGKILVGASDVATEQNIKNAINAIHPEVTAAMNASAKGVIIEAKIAGSAGNSIELSTNSTAINIFSAMQGGLDQSTTYTVKDRTDQPKNSIIQINFDESINPLMVSGSSEEIKDQLRVVNADATSLGNNESCNNNDECRSYKCVANKCEGDQLKGNFIISNQYRTVEFISDVQCGVNGCGEKIYCLPANSNLKVEVVAASLLSCTPTGNECSMLAPYNTCQAGVCYDAVNKKNYPTASTLNGIVDLANNSLDGNRDDNPQGQPIFYNENNKNIALGDNYLWSFWISDRLDLTPPAIFNMSVKNNDSNVNLKDAIEITFTKLMMSASLSTGEITVNNGLTTNIHKLINLWSLTNDPIGYWIAKADMSDRTVAYLKHGDFNSSTDYDSQVGSGVKDLYQNCYKPSAGEVPGQVCSANSTNPSCCRDGAGNLVPTKNLTPEGNCPTIAP